MGSYKEADEPFAEHCLLQQAATALQTPGCEPTNSTLLITFVAPSPSLKTLEALHVQGFPR